MPKITPQRIVHALGWRYYHIQALANPWKALLKLKWHMLARRAPKPHGLPGELIVSLTSYGPRFATLSPTLQCLLTQTMKPDRVILWIGRNDLDKLPWNIREREKRGLEIRVTEDIGPYTKIIPALRAFPNAFIITVDDDQYYEPDMLEKLIRAWDGDMHKIVCHRAHEIKLDTAGAPIRYNDWIFDVAGLRLGTGMFPTGVGGVMYPPGSLAKDVTDQSLFMKLAPKADDVWLYWMGRRAGAIYIKTPGRTPRIRWPSSQKTALMHENVGAGANDIKIQAMISHFGWPG